MLAFVNVRTKVLPAALLLAALSPTTSRAGEHFPVLCVADLDALLPEKPHEESIRLQPVSARKTLDCARTEVRLALKIADRAMPIWPSKCV